MKEKYFSGTTIYPNKNVKKAIDNYKKIFNVWEKIEKQKWKEGNEKLLHI